MGVVQVGAGAGGKLGILLLVIIAGVLLVGGVVFARVLLVEGGDVLVVPLAVGGALAVYAQLRHLARGRGTLARSGRARRPATCRQQAQRDPAGQQPAGLAHQRSACVHPCPPLARRAPADGVIHSSVDHRLASPL